MDALLALETLKNGVWHANGVSVPVDTNEVCEISNCLTDTFLATPFLLFGLVETFLNGLRLDGVGHLAFEWFNAELFGSSLPFCLVTFQRSKSAYGHYWHNKFQKRSGSVAGKTPVLTGNEAKVLFASIETDTLIGLRDRALLGVIAYRFA